MRLKLVLLLASWLALTLSSQAQPLPAEVSAALARAKVPQDAVSVWIGDVDGAVAPRLQHRAEAAMNPASVMKLVTTYAALDLLGPAATWRTPVWLDGTLREGVLTGNVHIQGQGDPSLVLEKLWLLLRRLQGLGVQTIVGDIVLDQHLFDLPAVNPAEFDGEPLRPYNAAPEALLINFKSVVMSFVPDVAAGFVRVAFEPPLWGVQMQRSVPLQVGKPGAERVCSDYRSALKADFSDPMRMYFAGSYPAACGEKVWPVAYADPASYNARAIQGLWHSMGGKLLGTVRLGLAPATAPAFEHVSPTLAEVIRDINKYSNNVMAQQVFLSLGRLGSANASWAASREQLRQWWLRRIGSLDIPVLDNGSGLSRRERISAQALARMLSVAYASPNMPELMASLPLAGVDGTLKRSRSATARAHLKTGSLRDVVALAGYVHARSGKRFVLVAMVNHSQAHAAREALDALLDWTFQDQ